MKRREFIGLLAGAASTLPLSARAQNSATPVVGFLHQATSGPYNQALAALRRGLADFGYVEGQNISIDYRWANNQPDRLAALAAELASRPLAAIVVAGGTSPARVAKAATSTIPIVLAVGIDPVALGLVQSFNRPGGNITGATFITVELAPKRLELLRDLVPHAKKIGYLSPDPRRSTTAAEQPKILIAVAHALGKELVVLEAHNAEDFEKAFETFSKQGVGGLAISTNPIFTSNRHKLLALAAHYKIPAIYHLREFVLDGGLMSYGASVSDAFRLAGTYVGRILEGARPADLPIQQSNRFEFVLNAKTAKELGLTVPRVLLARADEIIG
jgi:putative tryptophan/tyrosine transport system substrate-binding protein